MPYPQSGLRAGGGCALLFAPRPLFQQKSATNFSSQLLFKNRIIGTCHMPCPQGGLQGEGRGPVPYCSLPGPFFNKNLPPTSLHSFSLKIDLSELVTGHALKLAFGGQGPCLPDIYQSIEKSSTGWHHMLGNLSRYCCTHFVDALVSPATSAASTLALSWSPMATKLLPTFLPRLAVASAQ